MGLKQLDRKVKPTDKIAITDTTGNRFYITIKDLLEKPKKVVKK
jgi:hypothetical protein